MREDEVQRVVLATMMKGMHPDDVRSALFDVFDDRQKMETFLDNMNVTLRSRKAHGYTEWK